MDLCYNKCHLFFLLQLGGGRFLKMWVTVIDQYPNVYLALYAHNDPARAL